MLTNILRRLISPPPLFNYIYVKSSFGKSIVFEVCSMQIQISIAENSFGSFPLQHHLLINCLSVYLFYDIFN